MRTSGTAPVHLGELVTSPEPRLTLPLTEQQARRQNSFLSFFFFFFKDQFGGGLSPKNACKAAATCVCHRIVCWNGVSWGEAALLPQGAAGDTVCSHSHRRLFIDTDVALAAGFKLDFFYFTVFPPCLLLHPSFALQSQAEGRKSGSRKQWRGRVVAPCCGVLEIKRLSGLRCHHIPMQGWRHLLRNP